MAMVSSATSRFFTLPIAWVKDGDGDMNQATGKVVTHFILEQRSSYGFYVEIQPESPIDSTQLVVKEGGRTLQAIEVVLISAGL